MRARVRLGLDPESVVVFDVTGDSVGGGLDGIDDDRVVIGSCDRTHSWAEFPGEEVIPGLVAMVWFAGIALELLSEVRHGGLRIGAEPALMRMLIQDVGGVTRAEESAPRIQHLL